MTATRPAFAPWDVRTSPRIVSPEESARRVRIFASVEEQAAQLLESFSGSIDSDHGRTTLTILSAQPTDSNIASAQAGQ